MTDRHRLEETLVAVAARPSVVSILSGKGGVGKSVIALNLAERLAARGQKVLLVDADLYGGNLHILANVTCEHGIEDILSHSLTVPEAITTVWAGVDLLASVAWESGKESVTVSSAANLAEQLREKATEYDTVIIDHSSGNSEFATVLANASDLNLMILVPELTSIADCFGLLKYLYRTNPSIDCRLLVNRVESDDEFEFLQTRFLAVADQFLDKAPAVLGFLSEDTSVRQAVASQAPLTRVAPQATVVQELNRICEGLGAGVPQKQSIETTERININPALADIRG